MSERLFINNQGTVFLDLMGERRAIGIFDGDGTFVTTMRKKHHKFKIHDGWGICKKLVDSENVKNIVFRVLGKSYKIPKDIVIEYSHVIQHGNFEAQYIFPDDQLKLYAL